MPEPTRTPRARPKATDPLIAAVIAKLPPQGHEFPADRQKAWLQLMAMALATTYGGEVLDAEPARAAPAKAVTPKPKFSKPQPVYPFEIDKEGYARNGKTKQRIMPSEVADVLYDLRGEAGDTREIVWADDSTGSQHGARGSSQSGHVAHHCRIGGGVVAHWRHQ